MNSLLAQLDNKISRFRLLHTYFHLRLHLNDPATNAPKAETAFGNYPPDIAAQIGYIEDIGLLWKEIDSLCQQIIALAPDEDAPRPPAATNWKAGLTVEQLTDKDSLIRYLVNLVDN